MGNGILSFYFIFILPQYKSEKNGVKKQEINVRNFIFYIVFTNICIFYITLHYNVYLHSQK